MWEFIKDAWLWLIRFFSSKTRIKELENKNLELEQRVSKGDEEKIELQKIISELKVQSSEQPLKYDNHFHYYTDESNHVFCPPCYDTKKIKVHLKPWGNPIQFWQCPNPECKNVIHNPNYIEPPYTQPKWEPFDDL